MDTKDITIAPALDTSPYWFLSRSGRLWDMDLPSPSMIFWPDIAESLAKQCRFNGHAKGFYSIAQHSILVCDYVKVNRRLKLRALLHDAHEAFTGDIIQPFKMLLKDRCPGVIEAVEERIDEAILSAAGLGPTSEATKSFIKSVDMIALATEWRDLVVTNYHEYPTCDLDKMTTFRERIVPMSWDVARDEFMRRLSVLL